MRHVNVKKSVCSPEVGSEIAIPYNLICVFLNK